MVASLSFWCSGGAIVGAGGRAISSIEARALRDDYVAAASTPAARVDPLGRERAAAFARQLDDAIAAQAFWRRAARGLGPS